MRFTEEVVLFDFAGIPMVGCLGTGYAIGLTEQGAAVCARMLEEDVPEDDVTAVDPALLEHLARGGFFQRVVAEPRVLSAYLHVTQRCNLACAGCYSLDEHRNRLADAPFGRHEARGGRACRRRIVAADHLGAASRYWREDLPDIVEHAKRACGIASVTVLSNGTRMTEEALERLAPNVDCVSVSFDGCSAAAPAYIRSEQRFDELVEAVRMVQRAGIPAHIIPTVHAKNVDDLASYVQLSRDLGASLNFSLLTCEPDDEVLGGLLPGADELRMLGRALLTLDNGKPLPAMDAPVGVNLTVKRNCGAGCKSLSVDADGTIYPCHMLHRPELAMGNAFTGAVLDALQTDVSRTFQTLDAEKFEDCGACRYLRICGGGCRAARCSNRATWSRRTPTA